MADRRTGKKAAAALLAAGLIFGAGTPGIRAAGIEMPDIKAQRAGYGIAAFAMPGIKVSRTEQNKGKTGSTGIADAVILDLGVSDKETQGGRSGSTQELDRGKGATQETDSESSGTQKPDGGSGDVQEPDSGSGGTQEPGSESGGTQKPDGGTGDTQDPDSESGDTQKPDDGTGGTQTPGSEAGGTQEPDDAAGGIQTPEDGSDGVQETDGKNTDPENPDTEKEPDSETENETKSGESELSAEDDPEEAWDTKNTESEFDEMEVEEASLYAALAQADRLPSGTPVVGAAGWMPASMTTGFSPDFYPVRFYGGVSSIEAFNQSKNVVVSDYEGRPTFYPTKGGLGGQFGVIYRKVLYDGAAWYDLKMTVISYTTSVRSDGGEMVTSYPYIGFTTGEIGWKFNTALGGVVMKCEFLNSASGVTGAPDIRFQWWDVDAAQQFGIKPVNGSIAGRYYYASGSTVYHQNNVSIAGVSGMETVVGQPENASSTDPAYCVAYELKGCAAYYMGIGIRDHIDDDANSYTKKQLERVNGDLAEGRYTGVVEELRQTDTSLNKIRTPAPVKAASNDGQTWVEQNRLGGADAVYWYQIRQFVPWQSSSAYYASFAIKDILPEGVAYAGNLQIIREEDGADVTGLFTVSSEQNVILAAATAAARESASFYGYHYAVRFCAKMETEKLQPTEEGNRAEYTVQNHAKTIVKHSVDEEYLTENSNTVTTLVSLERKEPDAPEKGFDEKKAVTEKTLKTAEEPITYSIFQEIPENGSIFHPTKIEFTDRLEECLEYEAIEVKLKKAGSTQWEVLNGWEQENDGQTVRVNLPYAQEYGGGTLLYNLTCRIRKNFALHPWQSAKEEEGVWTTIPNKASVAFLWEKGEPLRVEKESNEAKVKLRELHLRLGKEIAAADIVWAHGNPTFTFKVTGTDLSGQEHTWYQTLEFRSDNAGSGERALLTADFIVPAGDYTATEEKTMRYRLAKIYGVSAGEASGSAVQFHLDGTQDGAAIFYNEKTTDEEESHSAFVKNHIGQ